MTVTGRAGFLFLILFLNSTETQTDLGPQTTSHTRATPTSHVSSPQSRLWAKGFASSRPGCGIKSAPSRTNRGFASLSKYLYHNECARLSARGCCQRPLSMYPPPNHLAPLRGTFHLLAHPADADACVVKESILLGDRLGPHRQSLLNWLRGRGCRRGGLVRHRRVVPAWSAAG